MLKIVKRGLATHEAEHQKYHIAMYKVDDNGDSIRHGRSMIYTINPVTGKKCLLVYAAYDHNTIVKYAFYRDNGLNVYVADGIACGMYNLSDRKCMLFRYLDSIYRVECCVSGVDDTLILTIAKCINTNEFSISERGVEKLTVDRQRSIYDLHYDMFTHHVGCGEKITYLITRGKLYDSMRNATKIKTIVHIEEASMIKYIRNCTEDYDTPNGMAYLALSTSLNLKISDDVLLIFADWLQKYHISLTTDVICLEK